uniref:Uncharacterized protein n=1 Tax=Cebus imitator TaxID=2715852 RepID=A0A2K5QQK8_CEBIM
IKVGLRGDRRSDGDEVLDPLRQALDSSMQSHSLYQHPQHLAFHVSAPVASTVQQASGLLGPLPHLSSFALQPAHSFLPPLGSHGAEVSKKNGTKAERKCDSLRVMSLEIQGSLLLALLEKRVRKARTR